jgi:hypothetical protein
MMTNLRPTMKLKERTELGSCVQDHYVCSGQGDVTSVLVIGMPHLHSSEPSLQLYNSSTETTHFMDLIHSQRIYRVFHYFRV